MRQQNNLLLAPLLVLALHCKSFSCRPHAESDNRRQVRSVAGGGSNSHIFTARLADEAPRNLGNPCFSSSRTPETSRGLGVSGREAEARLGGMAHTMLVAVERLNASLVRPHICLAHARCGKSTPPSAPNTQFNSLNESRPEANPPDVSRFSRYPHRILFDMTRMRGREMGSEKPGKFTRENSYVRLRRTK